MKAEDFLRPHLLKLKAYTPIEPFEILAQKLGRDPKDIVRAGLQLGRAWRSSWGLLQVLGQLLTAQGALLCTFWRLRLTSVHCGLPTRACR